MFELLYVANIKVPLSVFRGFLVTLGREDHLGQMESQYVTRLLTHTHTHLMFTVTFSQCLWLNPQLVQQFASVFGFCLKLFSTSIAIAFHFVSCLQLL